MEFLNQMYQQMATASLGVWMVVIPLTFIIWFVPTLLAIFFNRKHLKQIFYSLTKKHIFLTFSPFFAVFPAFLPYFLPVRLEKYTIRKISSRSIEWYRCSIIKYQEA